MSFRTWYTNGSRHSAPSDSFVYLNDRSATGAKRASPLLAHYYVDGSTIPLALAHERCPLGGEAHDNGYDVGTEPRRERDSAGLRRIEVENDVGHLDVKLRDRQGPDIAGAVPLRMFHLFLVASASAPAITFLACSRLIGAP